MKYKLILLLLIAVSFLGTSQNEKPHFCTRDTSEHKERDLAYDGYFNVDISKRGNYYVNDQYSFTIPNDSLKKAFSVVSKVELSSPIDGVYEKMGSFNAGELHAPSSKKDVLMKGKYSDTWGFNKNVEIWYNGEYIKLIFPKLINSNFQSFKHSFYIKKDCYQNMLNTFKPRRKKN